MATKPAVTKTKSEREMFLDAYWHKDLMETAQLVKHEAGTVRYMVTINGDRQERVDAISGMPAEWVTALIG